VYRKEFSEMKIAGRKKKQTNKQTSSVCDDLRQVWATKGRTCDARSIAIVAGLTVFHSECVPL